MHLELRDVVQTRGVGRRQVTVLRGATLTVSRGECVLLEGPSGSGKTTLLAVAAGLLTPSGGEVLVEGRRVNAMSPGARCSWRAGAVGFVFQRANLLSGVTVLDNVVLAARLAGASHVDGRRQALELLARLGVGHLVAHFPRELSGGEEQRVAVARALVHRPAVVLADEPTGSLDQEAGLPVVVAMTQQAKVAGCAVVIATHDVTLAPFATRRVRLHDGRITNA
jgi:ABC-type lipoprotein export system ATPase subunit